MIQASHAAAASAAAADCRAQEEIRPILNDPTGYNLGSHEAHILARTCGVMVTEHLLTDVGVRRP